MNGPPRTTGMALPAIAASTMMSTRSTLARLIIGPMALAGSDAGPGLTASRRAPKRARTVSRIGRWTSRRLPVMQNCPAKTVSAFSITGSARSRSASSNTTTGVLPPSSRPKRFRCFAPAAEIALPVAELPVKLIVGTSGESIIARAPSLCSSEKTLRTPFGRLATSAKTSHILALVWAVQPDSFPTTVQPAAKAGASERIKSTTGEFHGAMIPATPTGWRSTVE